MKIPKKLKVGGQIYDVSSVKSSDEKKQHNNWGKTNHGTQKIYLDRELPQTLLEEVFLHELLHAATNHCGLNMELGDKEEDFVNRMSTTLYMILKDNRLI